jgi:hypothetical protein
MRERLLAAAASMLLASCATGTDDTFYDVWVDTGVDTLDSAWDIVDTGVDDPGWDTARDPDVDPDPDPDPDPDLDPDPEPEPTCTPITSSGACNLIEQCGCPPWMNCFWDQLDSPCGITEVCLAVTAGSGTHGATCTGDDSCALAHSCLTTGTGPGTCYKWCRTSSDCPTGHTCDVSVSFNFGPPCTGTTTFPISACSYP